MFKRTNTSNVIVWAYVLHSVLLGLLRAQLVADAFTKQMDEESSKLTLAKRALEHALSSGGDLVAPTKCLEDANNNYKSASLAVRKHAVKPKAAKAKAKASAQPAA